jgi:hypothetical protein
LSPSVKRLCAKLTWSFGPVPGGPPPALSNSTTGSGNSEKSLLSTLNLSRRRTTQLHWGISISSSTAAPPSDYIPLWWRCCFWLHRAIDAIKQLNPVHFRAKISISLPQEGCRVDLRTQSFRRLLGVPRVAARTRALLPIYDTLIEGFSHSGLLRSLPALGLNAPGVGRQSSDAASSG